MQTVHNILARIKIIRQVVFASINLPCEHKVCENTEQIFFAAATEARLCGV